MRVLLTGGSGFLGSHIADALSDAGHSVTILDRQESPYLRRDQEFILGDILDADLLIRLGAQADAIYHIAGLADINVAMHKPRETVEANIIGTLNVLEAARENGVKRLLFASSIYVYSNKGLFYRTSKQAGENLIYDYQERYGLPYTILRFGSLYGPRSDEHNAVYRMFRQALTGGRIEYRGTGREVREYINVLDAAKLSVAALGSAHENQILHLTGRERMTTREMLEMINEIMGGRVELVFSDDTMTGHYVQTPYSYTPKLGRRISGETYIDLGLGLLDVLAHMDGADEH